MTVDANRVSDERLAAMLTAEIPLGMSVADARSILTELQTHRRSPSLSGGETGAPDHAGLASRVFYPVNNPSAWPDGFNQNISDLLHEAATALSAASPAPLEGVRVKPLEWMNHGPCDQTADSAAGQYRILVMDGDWVLFLPGIMPGVRYKSQVTAWTAAQADYERRILSAIVGSDK